MTSLHIPYRADATVGGLHSKEYEIFEMDIDHRSLICLDDFLNLCIKQLNESDKAVQVISIISELTFTGEFTLPEKILFIFGFCIMAIHRKYETYHHARIYGSTAAAA